MSGREFGSFDELAGAPSHDAEMKYTLTIKKMTV